LLRGDAIVVLCGEDAELRLAVGVELLLRQAAPLLVLSGGLDHPPRILGARSLAPVAMGRGVAPDRLILEQDSHNTHENAVHVIEMAIARGWKRILLVASPYHLPRAFLTFVRRLHEMGEAEKLYVVPVPASQTPWFQPPPGAPAEDTRLALYRLEAEKVGRYGDHVATYAQGLAYLQRWEGV
jgi:uncharacterized SAM-binding protein YcdF (DUF218 family)